MSFFSLNPNHFSKFWFRLAVGCCLPFFLGAGQARAEKNVLIIHSYHPTLSWTAALKRGIEQEFEKSEEEVQLFHEFLDAKRFPNLEHQQKFLDTIQTKYQNTSLSVVMVSDDPGLGVILQHRDTHFPNLPIVFLGINKVQPELLKQPQMTGVFETHDRLATAAEALSQTESEGIIILADSSETGQAESSKAGKILEMPNPPKELVVLEDLTPASLKHRLKDYPSDWPILLWGQLRQGSETGPLIDFHEIPRIIRSTVPNPLYSSSSTHIGHGVVGGKVLNGEQHAKEAVEIASQILEGQAPEMLPPITNSQNTWFFDDEELKRFSISRSELPAGSQLFNLQTSFYQQYRQLVWLTASAFTATLLIIGLLIEVLRRRAIAARILEENQQRYKDLAEAGANVFWELDSEMKFSYISGDTRNLNGLAPSDFLGRSPKELFRHHANIEFDWSTFVEQFKTRQPIQDFQFRIREGDSGLRIFKINGHAIWQEDRFLGYRGIKREITEEYHLAENLAYQATYDPLTGLVNRQTFDQRLQSIVDRVQQSEKEAVLCYLDLDQFKIVNDTAGHLAGDCFLNEIAEVLKRSVRTADTLGRLGGDEFGLILEGCSVEQAHKICTTLLAQIQAHRFHWGDRQFSVGCSIGVVSISANGSDAVSLLSRADLACYRAKDAGRGRIYIVNIEDQDLATQQTQMVHLASLAQAIEENRFSLMQQPIISLGRNDDLAESQTASAQELAENATHFEVLLRLHDAQGKMISPGLFIPEAERYGLIGMLDRWVLQAVLRKAAEWCQAPNSLVSINLSGSSLSNERFLQEAMDLIQTTAVPPHYICFEITETAAISHLQQAKVFITTLKELGVKFALDDFGSGVSSFGYLRELPVDFLKIDGSLVKHICTEETDRAIVKLINDLAHMMGMETIAEFVETEEMRQCLIEIGVDHAQGYLIGRPRPLLQPELPETGAMTGARA